MPGPTLVVSVSRGQEEPRPFLVCLLERGDDVFAPAALGTAGFLRAWAEQPGFRLLEQPANAKPPRSRGDRGGSTKRTYRYVPVFVAVSIARPASWFFPVTSVRM